MSGGEFGYLHTRSEFDDVIESLECFIEDSSKKPRSVFAAIKVLKNIKKAREQMRVYDLMVSGDTSEKDFPQSVWDIESNIDNEF